MGCQQSQHANASDGVHGDSVKGGLAAGGRAAGLAGSGHAGATAAHLDAKTTTLDEHGRSDAEAAWPVVKVVQAVRPVVKVVQFQHPPTVINLTDGSVTSDDPDAQDSNMLVETTHAHGQSWYLCCAQVQDHMDKMMDVVAATQPPKISHSVTAAALHTGLY